MVKKTSDDGGRSMPRENQGTDSRERDIYIYVVALAEEIKDRQRPRGGGEKAAAERGREKKERNNGERMTKKRERTKSKAPKRGDEKERK